LPAGGRSVDRETTHVSPRNRSYLVENERSRLLVNAGGIAAGAPAVQRGSGSYDDTQMWKLTLAQ
jgi:hypothetical protein